MKIVYEVTSLESSREFLRGCNKQQQIILTNAPNTTLYYGMLVIDYMFKSLKSEFSNIIDIQVNTINDSSAYYTAIKLGYKNIISKP